MDLMSAMQSEVFDAFRSVGVEEAKALSAAAALNERDHDVTILKSDMAVMKWMMGFILAFQIGIFVKLIIH